MPYKDPAAKKARDRQYREERRAELAAKQRAYYAANRERSDADHARYLAENPQIKRRIAFAHQSNRRAAHQGACGKLYARDLPTLADLCVYCNERNAETWDHVVPLCLGGANDLANLAPCCHPCNRSKARRTLEQWRPSDLDAVADILRRRQPAKEAA